MVPHSGMNWAGNVWLWPALLPCHRNLASTQRVIRKCALSCPYPVSGIYADFIAESLARGACEQVGPSCIYAR